MNLINAYNENGIYFLFRDVLWWFNGKRIEKWCYDPNIFDIFIYNNKLYGLNVHDEVFILNNQQFKYCGSLKEILKVEHVNP